MVSANNLKQYARPDVSQMTLDVIEAYKTNQTVQFKYGGQDAIRELFIIDWHEDYYTFHGWLAPEGEGGEYRKFRFDKVDEWLGIPIQYKVYVELDMSGYPTDKEVTEKLHELLDSAEPVVYRLEPLAGE
jgi:hypothetical protein|tara:strand:+ start:51 stop:440 length:390 start_codon:yes stop_codon:yes gene_type:complete